MDFTYRRLDSFGNTFFRILQRRNSDDAWQVVSGTFDYDREDEAQRKVNDLARKTPGYIIVSNQNLASWR